jgi:hypothetical protein
MAEPWFLSDRSRALLGLGILVLICSCTSGCGGRRVGTTDPEAKLRLERLLEVYQLYADQKQKAPPNEQALKEFIRKLPKEHKEALNLGDDVDSLLVSPRDGQKYQIRYNLPMSRSGDSRAVAWEQTGQGGKRFVALAMGYVEQYGEEEFKQLNK